MYGSPDPDWYFDNVLADAEPGGTRRPRVPRQAERWQRWWDAQAAASDPVVIHAARQGFVLTVADRDRLGVTRSKARNEIRSGRWTSAGYGLIAPVDVREPAAPRVTDSDAAMLAARRRHALFSCGAARRRPGSRVSGRSAAILHGLPTYRIGPTPELTEPDVGQGRRNPAHVYAATLTARECRLWHGVEVESVGRTLVTMARHGRRDAIMAADAALRENLIDRDGILNALDTAFGWPWVRQARAVLGLADPRSESPLESITRLAIIDAGLPEPQLQVVIGGDRVDFYWERYGLVLEADGAGKYVGNAWIREKRRERRLLRHAEVRHIERVDWSDVVDTWPATCNALAQRLH